MSQPLGPTGAGRLVAYAGFTLLAVIVLSLTLIRSDTAFAAFEPHGTVTLSNPAPGANSNITTAFCIDYNADCTLLAPPANDYNFGTTMSFTPKDFTIAKGSDIPDGAGAGFLASTATLGIVNGPCASQLRPEFKMRDATTDVTNVLPNAYGASAGRNPGTEDDQYDVVGGVPLGVTKYPDYLTRLFKDAGGQIIVPRARTYGQALVTGVDVSLNFVVFEPGVALKNPATGIVFQTDPALGYPSVTVLQALGDPDALVSASTITDFCSPLDADTFTCAFTQDASAMTAANPCPGSSGTVNRANPGSNMTVNFVTFVASQRDADGDSFENGLDTCPFVANVENPHDGNQGSPTYAQGPDVDNIDSACDPDPGPDATAACWPNSDPILPDTATATDCDGDVYMNAGDNCPQIANGQEEASTAAGNQKDSDSDGIGDPCDNNPTTPDGEPIIQCVVTQVNIGSGGTPPAQPNICGITGVGIDVNPQNGIFDSLEGGPAAADSDGDTVPDSSDQCANTPAGSTVDAVGCTTQQAAQDDDKDGVKNASDICPGTPTGQSVDSQGCTAAQRAARATTATSGGDAGPVTGIGSLAPAAASIPAWAAIASGLGGAGLLGSLGAFAARVLRRKR